MSRSRILIGGGVGVVVLLALVAWWLGYFTEPAEEANVEDLAAAVEEQAEADAADGGEVAGPIESLDGTWAVTPVEGQTFIGYRINEVLTTVGDFTVVGRTTGVSGTMEGAGTTITAVEVVGDMTSITTDNSTRDNAMKSQALETDQFPEATFVLAEPIELGAIPDEGTPVSAVAVGDLTIHGVTQRVEFPLEAQIQSGSIVTAGQLQIALADFGINAPSAPIVASVEDVAILELSLVFRQ
jgi:polyisoprenoid-binding protein YceI